MWFPSVPKPWIEMLTSGLAEITLPAPETTPPIVLLAAPAEI